MALVDSNILARLENNLLQSRSIRDGYAALWVNVGIVVIILSLIGVFLYVQYNTTRQLQSEQATIKNIPQTQFVWNNSIRNSIELG